MVFVSFFFVVVVGTCILFAAKGECLSPEAYGESYGFKFILMLQKGCLFSLRLILCYVVSSE